MQLDTDIKFLPGVGTAKAENLAKELNIKTFEDLAYYFPYKYIDRSKFYYTTDIHSADIAVQLKGVIGNFKKQGAKFKEHLTATFTDSRGRIELVWFKSFDWIMQSIVPGKEYIIFGKPTFYQG